MRIDSCRWAPIRNAPGSPATSNSISNCRKTSRQGPEFRERYSATGPSGSLRAPTTRKRSRCWMRTAACWPACPMRCSCWCRVIRSDLRRSTRCSEGKLSMSSCGRGTCRASRQRRSSWAIRWASCRCSTPRATLPSSVARWCRSVGTTCSSRVRWAARSDRAASVQYAGHRRPVRRFGASIVVHG